jgi:hypothetical protein
VYTDLLDDDVSNIIKVSEGRWQIEECFRIMNTDFSTRPVPSDFHTITQKYPAKPFPNTEISKLNIFLA